MPAEPGTLKVSLATMPGIEKMTEKESAHPSQHQLSQLTRCTGNGMASSPPTSPTEPAAFSATTHRFKEVLNTENATDHLTNANEDDLCANSTASGNETPANSNTESASSSTAAKSKNQCQPLADPNSSTSGTKMARSVSMPLSQDSPGLKSARNQQQANSLVPHGGSNQMQRSFSVLSTQVRTSVRSS